MEQEATPSISPTQSLSPSSLQKHFNSELENSLKSSAENETSTKWANNLLNLQTSSKLNLNDLSNNSDSYNTNINESFDSFSNIEQTAQTQKVMREHGIIPAVQNNPIGKSNNDFNQLSLASSSQMKNEIKETKSDTLVIMHENDKAKNEIITVESQKSDTQKNSLKYIIDYPFKTIKHPCEERYPLVNVVKFLFRIIVNIILVIPVIVITVLFQPLRYLFHSTFKLLHLCHLSSTSFHSPNMIPQFLSPIELFWLYNSNLNELPKQLNQKEKLEYQLNLSNKSIGACLFFIEGYISRNTIRDVIKNKIIQLSTRSGRRIFERFTQRLYKLFAFGYVWLNCSEFDIEEHIVEINEENYALKTIVDIQNCVTKLMETHKFKKDKPLWTLYYIKSFGDDRSSVLIFLFHMCFADGVSLIRLFLKGIVDNRNSVEVKPRFAFFTSKYDFLKQFILGWSEMIYSYLFLNKDKNPLNGYFFKSNDFDKLNLKSDASLIINSKNTNNKVLSNESANVRKSFALTWSEPFSLYTTNRLKLVTRSKMNDIFISILAGIMRSYLQKKGINNPVDMHCLMPVDLTSNKYPFKLKNKSALCRLKVPVNTEGCIPRLWSTKSYTNILKKSSDYLLILFYKYFLFGFFPNSVAFSLVKYLINKNTFIASTLGAGDSTLQTVSLCNRNVKNIIYFYPTACNIAISFSIITYGDEVRLSIMADSNIITHPKLITKEFIKQLEVLTDLLSNRRIPGEIKKSTRPIFDFGSGKTSNSKNFYIHEEASSEELQQKMSDIQQELQFLTENFQKLDTNDLEVNKKKQVIAIKSEKLKKDFGEILSKFQQKQNLASHTMPSDDEDELDTADRIRLRSSSIASRISSTSNSRKNKDSIVEMESNHRTHSRQASKICSSDNSILPEVMSNNSNNFSIENEISSTRIQEKSNSNSQFQLKHKNSHRNKNYNQQNYHSNNTFQTNLSLSEIHNSGKENENNAQRKYLYSDSD